MQTETRRFIGETGTQAFDGYAGFRQSQSYQLRFTYQSGGRVAVELDHAPGTGPLVVEQGDFEKWWVSA